MPFLKEKILHELILINELLNELDNEEIFSQVSYRIDMLYLRLDLPLRKNSSLSYNLRKGKIR